MKVAVHYQVDITPEQRKALGAAMSNENDAPATREQIREFFEKNGTNLAAAKLNEMLQTYYQKQSEYYAALAKKVP